MEDEEPRDEYERLRDENGTITTISEMELNELGGESDGYTPDADDLAALDDWND